MNLHRVKALAVCVQESSITLVSLRNGANSGTKTFAEPRVSGLSGAVL
jgi:hypothetical protein